MYSCKTNRHWWTEKADAEKCCNGWVRILLVGRDALDRSETPLIQESGTVYGRAWSRQSAPDSTTGA